MKCRRYLSCPKKNLPHICIQPLRKWKWGGRSEEGAGFGLANIESGQTRVSRWAKEREAESGFGLATIQFMTATTYPLCIHLSPNHNSQIRGSWPSTPEYLQCRGRPTPRDKEPCSVPPPLMSVDIFARIALLCGASSAPLARSPTLRSWMALRLPRLCDVDRRRWSVIHGAYHSRDGNASRCFFNGLSALLN